MAALTDSDAIDPDFKGEAPLTDGARSVNDSQTKVSPIRYEYVPGARESRSDKDVPERKARLSELWQRKRAYGTTTVTMPPSLLPQATQHDGPCAPDSADQVLAGQRF
jgi:hypothetical protein